MSANYRNYDIGHNMLYWEAMDGVLARDGAIPLYRQLKLELQQRIADGEWKFGERIPSERELCEAHGVSRITVRQAIAEMVHEGLLERSQGKGTFVARPKISQPLSSMTPFETTLANWGLVPSTHVLEQEFLPADFRTAEVLEAAPGELLLRLSLLGMGDGKPLVHYTSYFRAELGRSMAEAARRREAQGRPFSTIDLYGDTGRTSPALARQTFEAAVADQHWGKMLDVPRGAPLLVITSLFLDERTRPLEFRVARYRGDKYRFYILRQLKPGDGAENQ